MRYITLIRPSVQFSLDLIPLFAEAALSSDMPNTELPRWAVLSKRSAEGIRMQQAVDNDPCAQGTCGHIVHNIALDLPEYSCSHHHQCSPTKRNCEQFNPCAVGECGHRTEAECAVDPDCEWMCGHLSERLNHHRP